MPFLMPASAARSHTTVSIYGGPGAGKTLTLALLAIGASKHLHGSAPIAMLDPENASPFIARLCELEGVPLLVGKGRSFVEMRDGLHEAASVGACVYFVDNLSAVFTELVEAQKAKLNLQGRKLPYQHREELKRIWEAWNREVDAAPLHGFFGGRLAFDYDDAVDDAGDLSFVKIGSKMRGDTDAGYEPDLLVEMEAVQHFVREKKSRSKKGTTLHTARIVKDRWMVLNGLQRSWPDLNAYKAGDFQRVWEFFAPHFAKLAIGQPTDTPTDATAKTSADLFFLPAGESAMAERLKRITIAAEDFHATLQILWPGTTHAMKACHTAAIEAIYRSRSWAEVETKTAEAVEEGAQLLRACEAALPREAEGVAPSTRAEVLAWILAVKTARDEANVI